MSANNPTPERIAHILGLGNANVNLLDQLVATGEAAFTLMRHLQIDTEIKCAFFQLEQQFAFYTKLMQPETE